MCSERDSAPEWSGGLNRVPKKWRFSSGKLGAFKNVCLFLAGAWLIWDGLGGSDSDAMQVACGAALMVISLIPDSWINALRDDGTQNSSADPKKRLPNRK